MINDKLGGSGCGRASGLSLNSHYQANLSLMHGKGGGSPFQGLWQYDIVLFPGLGCHQMAGKPSAPCWARRGVGMGEPRASVRDSCQMP